MTRWYIDATDDVGIFISALFEEFFPEWFALYKQAFEAGVWVLEDRGPFLGRVVVYKLQVNLHVDGQDGGPTISFPAGFFSGGEMYLPDLGAKLA